MVIFFYLFFAISAHASYHDEELGALWSAISDINHPTREDYLLIDEYLEHGERPYLDRLRDIGWVSAIGRWERIRSFRLLGGHQGMPLFERHVLGENPVPGRCILLFGSFNNIYQAKVREALQNLEERGYQGDVLVRMGGFPNTEHGGLKLCHIPYAFKAAFLKEAQLLGYREVLWLDAALHPLTNLSTIFSLLEEHGTFFVYNGTLLDNLPSHLLSAASELGVTLSLYDQIYHLASCIIGLNFETQHANILLDEWLRVISQVLPCMTWFPEELSLSIIAWRNQCQPIGWFGNYICNKIEINSLFSRPSVLFYLDTDR
jgi:hypothetical protein